MSRTNGGVVLHVEAVHQMACCGRSRYGDARLEGFMGMGMGMGCGTDVLDSSWDGSLPRGRSHASRCGASGHRVPGAGSQ